MTSKNTCEGCVGMRLPLQMDHPAEFEVTMTINCRDGNPMAIYGHSHGLFLV